MVMTVHMYEVGGCVRDGILDIPTKDIDFACEVTGLHTVNEAFAYLRTSLEGAGFEIFIEAPEYGTIRARFPEKGTSSPIYDRYPRVTADFVLCRKEGPYSDGRHPDFVQVGTLANDLARRDFTVNALAIDIHSPKREIIDMFGGQKDLENRALRFVGNPTDRIQEDSLRALRAIRFHITKGLVMEDETFEAVRAEETAWLLESVSAERKREELERCFAHDTVGTLYLLERLPAWTLHAIFKGGLRLSATMKG